MPLDPATEDWVQRVIAAGGTVSKARKLEVNQTIVEMKASGDFAAANAYYLTRGAENPVQARTNLVSRHHQLFIR